MAPLKLMRKTYPILKLLSELTATQRTLLLEYLNDEIHCGIKNCIKNAVYNSDIEGASKHKLKSSLTPHKTVIHSIAKSKGKLSKKNRKQIKQIGGSLGAILMTVLPILADLLFKKRK